MIISNAPPEGKKKKKETSFAYISPVPPNNYSTACPITNTYKKALLIFRGKLVYNDNE